MLVSPVLALLSGLRSLTGSYSETAHLLDYHWCRTACTQILSLSLW